MTDFNNRKSTCSQDSRAWAKGETRRSAGQHKQPRNRPTQISPTDGKGAKTIQWRKGSHSARIPDRKTAHPYKKQTESLRHRPYTSHKN